MKNSKYLLVVICGLLIITLTGCKNKEKDTHSFDASVTKCEDNYIIVKPDEDEEIYEISSNIKVNNISSYKNCKVNARVKVIYSGNNKEEINATYIGLLK